MNKQEAIETIKNIDTLNINDMIAGQKVDMVIKNQVLDLISQIDQPQKVVIPKYIADKIEYCKNEEGYGLYHVMDYCYQYKDSADWLDSNEETFARAWYDGYEIEQEKLYEVIIPHTSNYKNQKQYLVKQGKNWFFCGNDVNRFKYQFTKGQIEAAGFGWVFDCNGMKVEEVE